MFPEKQSIIQAEIMKKGYLIVKEQIDKKTYQLADGKFIIFFYSNKYSLGIKGLKYNFEIDTCECNQIIETNQVDQYFYLFVCASADVVVVVPLSYLLKYYLRAPFNNTIRLKIEIIMQNDFYYFYDLSDNISHLVNNYDLLKTVTINPLSLSLLSINEFMKRLVSIENNILNIKNKIDKIESILIKEHDIQTNEKTEIPSAYTIKPLSDTEREAIVNTLEITNGCKIKACEILKISRSTLDRKILQYNININKIIINKGYIVDDQ